MKIKITVGMCSVDYEGEQYWSSGTFQEIIAALSKASVENGEKNAGVEMKIEVDGEVLECRHGLPLCAARVCAVEKPHMVHALGAAGEDLEYCP